MKEFRNPENVHAPAGLYSHQVELSGGERIVILAGQAGIRQDGTVPEDPIEQLDLTFENIRRNLQAAGMEMKDLVKVTYYLVGEWDTEGRRAVVSAQLGAHRPCSTLVYVPRLASPAYKVEIEAWASRAVEG
jgi:enamine deaminase RidA (YjgF/YER057c/UK114 family)